MSEDPYPPGNESQCIDAILALIPTLHETPSQLCHAVNARLANYATATLHLHTDLPHCVRERPNAIIIQGYAYGWIEGAPTSDFLLDLVAAVSQLITSTEQFTFLRFCRAHPELRNLRPITPRPREVLTLLETGLRHSKIADLLMMSDSTVNTHVRNLQRDFGADTGSRLIHLAKDAGLFHYLNHT
jgi:DNA-binding NarL/FixJ family response regulator